MNLVPCISLFYIALPKTGRVKRFLFSGCISFILLLPVSSQELFYYGVNSRPVDQIEEALTLKEVNEKSDRKVVITTREKREDRWTVVSKEKIRALDDDEWKIHHKADRLFASKFYRQYRETEPGHFFFSEYTTSSTIRSGGSTGRFPLHLEGTVTEFYPGGEVKSISEYRNNQLASNQNWLVDGTPYIDSIFYSADQEPEYEYGPDFFRQYTMQQINRSEWDLSQIQDKVVIGWVVMETGNLEGVIALEGKSRQLNQFLVNVISSMPGKWQPAKLNGVPVRYFMQIPLNFEVREVNFQELDYSTGRLHYSKY